MFWGGLGCFHGPLIKCLKLIGCLLPRPPSSNEKRKQGFKEYSKIKAIKRQGLNELSITKMTVYVKI